MDKYEKIKKLLNIEYPIIQGPFGGGFSTEKLTALVSNYGGLGSFGGHHLSQSQIAQTIRNIRSKTSNSFAINLWVSNSDSSVELVTEIQYNSVSSFYDLEFKKFNLRPPAYKKNFSEQFENQVQAILDERPSVFSFVFGIPSANVLEECRRKNIITVGAATTVDEAIKVQEAGVDAVVVSGFEAGGHRPSFLRPAEKSLMGLSSLLPQVREKINLPIIAAGGLVTAQQIRSAETLGADGFQLGTAFLACEESGASQIHKKALFSERAKKTILSKVYSGRLARFIENDFIIKYSDNHNEILPYPAQNYMLSELKKVSAEFYDQEVMPLYAGQGAPLLKHRTVKDLMSELISIVQHVKKN